MSQKGDQILLFNQEFELVHQFQSLEGRGKAVFINDQEIAIGYLYDDTERSSGFISYYDLHGQLTRQLGKPLHKERRKSDNILLVSRNVHFSSMDDTLVVDKVKYDTTFSNARPRRYTATSGTERVEHGNIYWNEMLVSPDGTKLILNSERFIECWDITNGVQHQAAVEDLGYLLDFSWDSKNLLFKKDKQASVYNWDLEPVVSIPGLYASSGLKGPRSGTWPSPITFLQTRGVLLIHCQYAPRQTAASQSTMVILQ